MRPEFWRDLISRRTVSVGAFREAAILSKGSGESGRPSWRMLQSCFWNFVKSKVFSRIIF